MKGDKKYRVWWIPRIATLRSFSTSVETPEEGKLVMRVMREYDQYISTSLPLSTLCAHPNPSCGLEVSTKDDMWDSCACSSDG